VDLKQLTAAFKGDLSTGIKVVHDPHDYNDNRKHATFDSADGVKLVSIAATDDEWLALLSTLGVEIPVPPPPPPPPDTTPPETVITAGPSSGTGTSAVFVVTSSELNSTFRYSLDGGLLTDAGLSIDTPSTTGTVATISLTGLSVGSHSLQIAATDAAGNTDPTPATWSWVVSAPAPPPPPTTTAIVGVNAEWFMGTPSNPVSKAQIDATMPAVIRDPHMVKAAWDYCAGKGIKVLPDLLSASLPPSWVFTHDAWIGVVEVGNEPFWAAGGTITAAAWIKQFGPLLDQLEAKGIPYTVPLDDWPTAHDNSPGAAGWQDQLFAARPSLKTKAHGFAVHPYGDAGPSQAQSHLDNVISGLKARGISNPLIYATEWGWSRTAVTLKQRVLHHLRIRRLRRLTGATVTESGQAANTQAFLATARPKCVLMTWFQENDENPSAGRDAGFGLYRQNVAGNWGAWTPVAVQAVIKAAAAK